MRSDMKMSLAGIGFVLTLALGFMLGANLAAIAGGRPEHKDVQVAMADPAPADAHGAPAAKADAAHGADGHGEDAHGAAEGHSAGGHANTIHGRVPKPLLGEGKEFLDVSPQLFLWTILVFVVYWQGLKYLCWQPILKMFREKDELILEGARQATLAKDEAQKLLVQSQDQMAKAHEEARHMIESARSSASETGDSLIAKAREESAEALRKAQDDIEAAKIAAMEEIRQSARGLGGSIASRVLDRPVDASQLGYLTKEVEG